MRVAEVRGDRAGRPVAHVGLRGAERGRRREFDFGAMREVDHRVREVELRLGQPDELDRARGGVGDEQRRAGRPCRRPPTRGSRAGGR